MKTLLAFAGSNSVASINHQLVVYTASLIEGFEVQVLKMTHYPFPLYSIDNEKEKGFLNSLIELKGEISEANGLIISVNEHNSAVSAYFKNLLDWLSRLDRSFLSGQKVFLMSATPGKRGGISALEYTQNTLPRFGAEVKETFSLPSFYDNFKEGVIVDDKLKTELEKKLKEFLKSL